jgi:hypothetical protein
LEVGIWSFPRSGLIVVERGEKGGEPWQPDINRAGPTNTIPDWQKNRVFGG